MAQVFISHSISDVAVAGEVRGWLVGDGHEVFLGVDRRDGIVAGGPWEERLYERLRWADAVVCVVTAAYIESRWCFAEIVAAKLLGSRLLPLSVELELRHPLLSAVQHEPYDGDRGQSAERVCAVLREVGAAGGAGWPDDRSPFPGLRPFDMEMHRAFFGRRREVEALLRRLRVADERGESQLVVVVGPSGSGKSSLVRAGLVPAVAGETGWVTAVPFTPGVDPVAGLSRVLALALTRGGGGGAAEASRVRDRLRDGDGLAGVAGDVLSGRELPGRRLLVVVDQFEEVLTRCTDKARAEFGAVLGSMTSAPVQVVATMRTEFLDRLLASPQLAGLPVRPEPLRPLSAKMLPVVIEGPARLAGLRVDPELVARMVADTSAGEALPLLAFTLQQLAAGLSRGAVLSWERYEHLGGVRGALTRQADTALADAVRAGGRGEAEVLSGLLRLVDVDAAGRPIRVEVGYEDLPSTVRAELDVFVARRLLTTGERDGTMLLSVAHEAFLSAWAPLAQAITAAGAMLRTRRAVEHAASDWDRAGRRPGYLWERGRVSAAISELGPRPRPDQSASSSAARSLPAGRLRPRRWTVAADRDDLTATARGFLDANIRHHERRRRLISAAVVAALVVSTTLTGFALRQRQTALAQRGLAAAREEQAKRLAAIADSRQLAGQSSLNLDRRPSLALLQALRAAQTADTTEARSSLLAALQREPHLSAFLPSPRKIDDLTFSADGKVLMWTAGRTVTAWDVQRRQRLWERSIAAVNDRPGTTVLSRDGRTLAWTDPASEYIGLWDLKRNVPLGRLVTNDYGSKFSPDGTYLVAFGRLRMSLWDVRRQTLVWTIPRRPDWATVSTAFSPNGKVLTVVTNPCHPVGGGDCSMDPDNATGLVSSFDLPHRRLFARPFQTHLLPEVEFRDDRTVALSADGRPHATLTLWDIGRGKRVGPTLGLPTSLSGSILAALPDENTVVLTGPGATRLKFWNTRSNTATTWHPGHEGGISRVAISADGRMLATASESDNTVVLWDIDGRQVAGKTVQDVQDWDHPRIVLGLSVGGDGSVSILSTPLGGVSRGRITVRTGGSRPEELDLPPGMAKNAENLAVSPDLSLIAAFSDGTVTLWDVQKGTRLGTLDTARMEDTAETVEFSPDGRSLATGGKNGRISLWSVPNLDLLTTVGRAGAGVTQIAFSGNGRRLAIGDEEANDSVWDAAEHRRVWTIPADALSGSDALALDREGHRLAVGQHNSDAGRLTIWPVDTAQPKVSLTGHTGGILGLAFSPDDRLLVSGDDRGVVFLWDVRESRQIGKLTSDEVSGVPSPLSGVSRLAFSDDGSRVASGGVGPVILWNIHTTDWIAEACSIVGPLTRDDPTTRLPNIDPLPTCR